MINLSGDDEEAKGLKEAEPLDGVVCTFWVQQIGCRKGEHCEFLHPAHLKATAKPKVCRFYKERGYCAKENECDFIHEGPPGVNTRICRFFAERGFCVKKDNCNFSHDIEPGSIPSRKICRFFAERGFCAKENNCDFSHDLTAGDSLGPPRSSRSSMRICRFYADTGYCAKGDVCDFYHDGPARSRDAEVCGFWIGGRCEKGSSCTFKHPPRRSRRGYSPELFDRYEKRRGLRGSRSPDDEWGRRRSPDDRHRRRPRSPRDRDRRDPWHRSDHREYRGERSRRRSRSRPAHERRTSSSLYASHEDRYSRKESNRRERERSLSGGIKRKWDPRDQEVRPGKRSKTRRSDDDTPVVFAKERVEIGERAGEVMEKLNKALGKIKLQACLDAVVEACKKCGEHIRNKVGEQRQEELSELDEECNGILAQAIARKYPLHGIVAKQNAECLKSVPSSPTWFICPLEGRDNFVRGSPFVCVSIGLCVQKIPVLGVIYNPILEQLASGFLGGGVYLEEKQIRVEDVKEMGEAIIANEYSRGSLRKRLCAGARVKSFRETGCFSQDFIDVLRGVCNGGFQEALPGPWSYCAGAAMIEEAGGVVTDLQGNLTELEMNERKLVFGSRKVVEEMVRYF